MGAIGAEDGSLARARRRLASLRRVVVWGHPLHSHTHSYIHAAFARAFRYLGAETLWTDDRRALGQLDLAGTLFLSEGQAVAGMPLRDDCHYVLHNVDRVVYGEVARRVLALQVTTNEVRQSVTDGTGTERLNSYTYAGVSDGVAHLYQPWATDLLPDEFDFDVSFPSPWPKGPVASRLRSWRTGPFYVPWVGTIGGGLHGNEDEIAGFRSACLQAGIEFRHKQGLSRAAHIRLVRNSFMAPAIVGTWQVEHGYIPCRIFKNVSYGRMALTNSPSAQALLDEPVLCRSDTAELFSAAMPLVRDKEVVVAQMKDVQAHHTYLNRIATILDHLP
jgi:hypothetical protein